MDISKRADRRSFGNGQIDPVIPDLPETQAVLWRHGNIVNLGTLPQGGYESEANSVNNGGQVVGAATNLVPDANSMILSNFLLWNLAYPYQSRAFVWDQKNGMQDLGTLPGGTDAEAIMNNQRGQVVGHSDTNTAPGACAGYGYALTTDSFIWDEKRGMKDIGSLGGTCTLAYAMNNHGQVVGQSFLTGDQANHPFLWDRATGLADLGTLGGNFGSANAVNENGEAAGWGNFTGDTAFHAALWTSVGQVIDLGAVGKDLCSYANGINDETQVVGVSERHCGNSDVARPFLWEHGSIVNLNNLIPPSSPLYLVYAYDINHRGEIVGNGLDVNGNEHAFLLIPCDENHPGIEGCDYSLVDVSAEPQTPEPTAAGATTNGSKRSARRALPRFLGRGLPGARISGASASNEGDIVSGACTRCCGQCRPVIELRPSNLDFPAQKVGTTSKPKTVLVENVGHYPAAIFTISTKPPFIESNTCPRILYPYRGCQIQVWFKPTTKGPTEGTLSVSDNALGSPQKVALSGLGN